MDALIVGDAVINDGCWSIRLDGGDIISPVAWPAGTALREGAIVIPDVAEPVRDGDHVELGGGEIPATDLPIPEQPCFTTDSVILLLNG